MNSGPYRLILEIHGGYVPQVDKYRRWDIHSPVNDIRGTYVGMLGKLLNDGKIDTSFVDKIQVRCNVIHSLILVICDLKSERNINLRVDTLIKRNKPLHNKP